jgi:Predicted S-adenosylmethionine-dependent methyltransferase involved in bacterial cell division
MARRVDWLEEVIEKLGLANTAVIRGRAEERSVREAVHGADVVTARAVAPMARLASWCLPLARAGGVLLALKGASAQDEVDRDRDAVRRLGGGQISVTQVGVGVLSEPTTVVSVTKTQEMAPAARKKKARR